MKLDQELVRKILLEIEANQEEPMVWFDISVEGSSELEVSYHIELLAEAGFIIAKEASNTCEYRWYPTRLTYNGHSFLETIRQPRIWAETKQAALKAGSMSLEILWEIGKELVRNELRKQGLLNA